MLLTLVCNTCRADLADRDQPVHLEADRVSIDDSRQTSNFEGHVQLVQGTMVIHGDKLVVTQDADGNTHGTAMGDPASFRQKREGTDEFIEGYGQRIEYDSRNGTIEFFGKARMTRGQDEVRGDYITYNANTEIFEVHSDPAGAPGHDRVHVTIQPRHNNPGPTSADGPASNQ